MSSLSNFQTFQPCWLCNASSRFAQHHCEEVQVGMLNIARAVQNAWARGQCYIELEYKILSTRNHALDILRLIDGIFADYCVFLVCEEVAHSSSKKGIQLIVHRILMAPPNDPKMEVLKNPGNCAFDAPSWLTPSCFAAEAKRWFAKPFAEYEAQKAEKNYQLQFIESGRHYSLTKYHTTDIFDGPF